MKNYDQPEVILSPKYSFNNLRAKELVRWLGITAQPAIFYQDEKAKKLFLKTLKSTPAIYMS